MKQGQPIKDASHLYEVERRAQHAARPGFRITELQLSPTQKVPWHTHTNVSDTFYVLDGQMRLFLQDPKEEVNLKRRQAEAAASGDQWRDEVAHLPRPAGCRGVRLRAAPAGLDVQRHKRLYSLILRSLRSKRLEG